jgi:hypothetical protein
MPLPAVRSLPKPLALAALLLWLQSGCQAGTDPGPTVRPATLVVEVVGASGAPAPGSLVVHAVWPEPTIPTAPPDRDERTDINGRMWIRLGSYPDAAFDSLRLRVQTRGCGNGGPYDFHLAATELEPGGQDSVIARLVVEPVPGPASASPGYYCAFGVHPDWGPLGEYDFSLRVISSGGEEIRGEWAILHSASIGPEVGTFAGTVIGTQVALRLVNSVSRSACAGTLRGEVALDGTWGPLLFSSPESCSGAPTRLDFAVLAGESARSQVTSGQH